MSLSLATKTVEAAAGTTIALPFHLDSATSYYYPMVVPVPSELGGCTIYHLAAAATTNATVVKASSGQVYAFHLFHVNDAPIYVTFYDLAVAPTVDTSTIKMKFGFQAAATAALGYGKTIVIPFGCVFATGIAIAVHKGIATSSAVDVSEVLLTIYYK
jgi:hypothetical protein